MQAAINFLPWATEHWWLAFWLAFWALVFGYLAFVVVMKVPFVLVQRALRALVILIRGWPPAHLDGDGDWKPDPKPDERDLGTLTSENVQRGQRGIITTRSYFKETT